MVPQGERGDSGRDRQQHGWCLSNDENRRYMGKVCIARDALWKWHEPNGPEVEEMVGRVGQVRRRSKGEDHHVSRRIAR